MSIALVIATQAQGTVIVHEKMYESRLFFVDKLIAMGAQIILCDPHRAVVVGPSRLLGHHVASPDIRAGMALVLAALAAQGTTVIDNVEQIDRGYQDIDVKLRALGAQIERWHRQVDGVVHGSRLDTDAQDERIHESVHPAHPCPNRQRKQQKSHPNYLGWQLVGAGGFEPPTSSTRTTRATKLRYAPNYGLGV